jgi:hypothetical protein
VRLFRIRRIDHVLGLRFCVAKCCADREPQSELDERILPPFTCPGGRVIWCNVDSHLRQLSRSQERGARSLQAPREFQAGKAVESEIASDIFRNCVDIPAELLYSKIHGLDGSRLDRKVVR